MSERTQGLLRLLQPPRMDPDKRYINLSRGNAEDIARHLEWQDATIEALKEMTEWTAEQRDALQVAEAMCEWLASQLVTARIRWPHLLGCYALPVRAEDVWLDAAREAAKEADSE